MAIKHEVSTTNEKKIIRQGQPQHNDMETHKKDTQPP